MYIFTTKRLRNKGKNVPEGRSVRFLSHLVPKGGWDMQQIVFIRVTSFFGLRSTFLKKK